MTREQRIYGLLEAANFGKDPFLREFGIQINPKMAEMNARVLPVPSILYNERNNKMVAAPSPL